MVLWSIYHNTIITQYSVVSWYVGGCYFTHITHLACRTKQLPLETSWPEGSDQQDRVSHWLVIYF